MSGFDPFEKAVHKAHVWLNEIARHMGDDATRQQAYAAMRAVLHALRDRLDVNEAAQLAAQLPLLVRGIYYEGWDPAKTPLKIRHRDEFLDLVRDHLGKTDNVEPEPAVKAVFAVLREHVSEGEIADVMAEMPAEIRELLAA